MISKLSQSPGFTLIELIIAVVISGMLLSGVLAAFRGLGAKQQIKQAGISFQTDLKSYQQKALSGQKPVECSTGGDTLSGYRIKYLDSNSYSVKAICQANVPDAVTVNLPDEISFSGSFSDIFFPVLHGEVNGAQIILLVKDGLQYEVVIESSGVIRGRML